MVLLLQKVRAIRPLNGLIAAMAVAVGVKLGGGADVFRWALASVSAFALISWANLHNDLWDLEADRINRPTRPIASGVLDPGAARVLLWILGILALPGLAVGTAPGLIYAGAWLGVYLYNRWLKGVPLVGHLAVAGVAGAGFLYGGAVGGSLLAPAWACGLALPYHLHRELVKSLEDVSGDRTAGRRTLAAIDPRTAGRSAIAVAVVLMASLPLPYSMGVFGLPYLALALATVEPLLAAGAISVARRRYTLARRLAKLGMGFALVALYFGT